MDPILLLWLLLFSVYLWNSWERGRGREITVKHAKMGKNIFGHIDIQVQKRDTYFKALKTQELNPGGPESANDEANRPGSHQHWFKTTWQNKTHYESVNRHRTLEKLHKKLSRLNLLFDLCGPSSDAEHLWCQRTPFLR